MTGVKKVLQRLKETCLLMVGVPDYRRYVEQARARHPERPVMSYEEFFWERQKTRYTGGKGRMHGGCS